MGDFCKACGAEGTRRNGICWDCYKKPGQLVIKHCPNCGGTELRPNGSGAICARCPDEVRQVQEANLRAHLESLQRLRGPN